MRHLARAADEGRLEEDFCACCLLGRLPCPGFGSRLASGRSPRISAELSLRRGAGEPDRRLRVGRV